MRLLLAIAASSLLHALLIFGAHWLGAHPPKRQAVLEVSFQQDAPAEPAVEPPPVPDAPAQPAPAATIESPPPADPVQSVALTAATTPSSLLYPLEAVQRGLEGEVTLLLILNEAGQIQSADVARSSGHAILDTAALQAAKRLGSLPGNPRQTMLPVRFSLR